MELFFANISKAIVIVNFIETDQNKTELILNKYTAIKMHPVYNVEQLNSNKSKIYPHRFKVKTKKKLIKISKEAILLNVYIHIYKHAHSNLYVHKNLFAFEL